ncbi:hypothetical protein VB773_21595 [Haloarculaceae archaeon H-GB2-1]|nr:hypothetical protein [Haloarculaceae archaeon H-GB2-1]
MTRLVLWPTATVLAAQWLLFPVAVAGAAGYDTTYGLVSLVVPPLYFLPLAVTRQRECHFASRSPPASCSHRFQ